MKHTPTNPQLKAQIRPYIPADRAAVHRIAADTAFFGQPVEIFLDDRRVFCDSFITYYTDLEPEHAWVADVDGEPAGFLLGCVETPRQQAWFRAALPSTLWKAVNGVYRVGKRTLQYALGMARASLRGEFTHIDLPAFPAHLHINLAARWRGFGLGRRLIEAYLNQLRQLGAVGVHLETTSQNVTACKLYERVGFALLDARPTRLWRRYLLTPVENRCYGLRL